METVTADLLARIAPMLEYVFVPAMVVFFVLSAIFGLGRGRTRDGRAEGLVSDWFGDCDGDGGD